MAGFGSGLAHAITAGLTGYQEGRDDRMKQLLALAAQQRAEQRQQEEMQLKRLSTFGGLAASGLDITGAVPDTASARATNDQNPTSPEGGAIPAPAQPSRDGTVIGGLGGLKISVPPGGPQSKAVREAKLRADERLQRLTVLNDAVTDPTHKKTPTQLQAIANDDQLYNQYVAQATGVAKDPLALHQQMRDYDVAHPTRTVTQEPSWQTVTTADGSMVQVNPKTGETRPIGLHGRVPATGPSTLRGGGAQTVAQKNKSSEIDTTIGTIDEALGLLAQHPKAVGLMSGRGVSDVLDQWIDPNGVAARAAMASVSSNLLHALSGAAISPKEFQRLRQYVPVTTDRYQAAVTKLKRLKTELERSKANMGGEVMQSSGPTGNVNLGASEDQQLWDAAVAKYGRERVLREYGERPK